jgi:hypothetical protein
MSESESNNGGFLWGVRAISREAGRTPRQMYHIIESGHLKCVKKIGGVYTAHRPTLRREIGAVEQRQHDEVAS